VTKEKSGITRAFSYVVQAFFCAHCMPILGTLFNFSAVDCCFFNAITSAIPPKS